MSLYVSMEAHYWLDTANLKLNSRRNLTRFVSFRVHNDNEWFIPKKSYSIQGKTLLTNDFELRFLSFHVENSTQFEEAFAGG